MNTSSNTSVSAPHRILVVDDNTAIHRDFEKILGGNQRDPALDALESDLFGGPPGSRPRTYQLSCAQDGQEALRLVQRAVQEGRPFSMAFVDMRMPGWDGVETVAQLARLQPSLQIAICSAYMDYSWHDILERLQRPGLRLLRKPWVSGEVLALVHEFTSRSQAAAGKAPAAGSPRGDRRH